MRRHWDVGNPAADPLVWILSLWGFRVSRVGLEVAGGCRGRGAEFKTESLEFIPSPGVISCVFASLRAGLTEVIKHCQIGYQLIF